MIYMSGGLDGNWIDTGEGFGPTVCSSIRCSSVGFHLRMKPQIIKCSNTLMYKYFTLICLVVPLS
jgi:hypothetical protein